MGWFGRRTSSPICFDFIKNGLEVTLADFAVVTVFKPVVMVGTVGVMVVVGVVCDG